MFLLKLFGTARLEGTSGPFAGRSTQRRRLALLAVLALERDRPVSRDKLLAYFWGESDTDHARALLSDSIYVLRKELGEMAILSASDDVQLNPEVVRCDVGEFANALQSGQLSTAVELYAGPLLDGFHIDDAPEFERRVETERDRLGRAYARALEDMAVACEATNRPLDAVEWWQRLVVHDPSSGRIARRLLQALDAAGDRAAALRFARAHVTRVREEFEIEPDPDVLDYMHDLQRTSRHRRAPEEISSLPEAIPTTQVAETGASRTEPRLPASPRGLQPWRAWLIGGGLLVAGAVAVAATNHRSVAASSGRPRTAVAVLPFRNLSPDSSNAFFAGGLHDELLTQLAKVSSLRWDPLESTCRHASLSIL